MMTNQSTSLGIKGVSDSMKIATQGLVDGAGAFLSRLCLPAAEELGLALRDRISAWRATNALRMLNEAHNIYIGNVSHQATDRLNPRLVHIAIEEASWIDDTLVQSMWAGLLAASASSERSSDDNLLFMNLLKHLTTLEVQILTIAVERARKTTTRDGFIIAEFAMRLPVRELPELFGAQDLQRLDRELDHLRELGLIAGGIDLSDGHADLTPTPLALHLYVRAHGSRLSPAAYWNLEPPTDGNSRRDASAYDGPRGSEPRRRTSLSARRAAAPLPHPELDADAGDYARSTGATARRGPSQFPADSDQRHAVDRGGRPHRVGPARARRRVVHRTRASGHYPPATGGPPR